MNIFGTKLAFVLDDETGVRSLICKILKGLGLDVLDFDSPNAFLNKIRLIQPDLVVLDLALGQGDAVDVLRQLGLLKFGGDVLLVSGRHQAVLHEVETIGIARGLSMLPSLQKPFRLDEIKSRLLAAGAGPPRVRSEVARQDRPPRVDLELAMRKNLLEVWYQPKFDLKTLTVCGAEALIRARHPTYGIVLPANLLPAAGDELYKPLSLYVMEQTMVHWKGFAQRGLPVKLSVNIPVSVLGTQEFIDWARRLIPSDTKFPGLIIEMTEDEIVRDPQLIYEIATQLKLYNGWISIDDFGSAYASLSRLKDVPFVELKLDRNFVTNCAAEPLKRALCSTVADLAHSTKALICAEGVETKEELQCLRDLGFDSAQGFYFAKPMPAKDLVEFLLAENDVNRFEPERPEARTM